MFDRLVMRVNEKTLKTVAPCKAFLPYMGAKVAIVTDDASQKNFQQQLRITQERLVI